MTDHPTFCCNYCNEESEDRDALEDHIKMSHMDEALREAVKKYTTPIIHPITLDDNIDDENLR